MRWARNNETADHPVLNGDKGGRVFRTSATKGVSARSIFGSESVEIFLWQQSLVGHLPRPNVDTRYLTCIIGSRCEQCLKSVDLLGKGRTFPSGQ